MTLTLADVRALVRRGQADATAWPDASIDAWIGQAIRLYSAHFPRCWRCALDLITGTPAYDLPGGHGFAGVVAVQYPVAQEPPRYLGPAAEWSARFQTGGPVYALRGVATGGAAESDTAAGQIVFAEPVATGEQAVIAYLGGHEPPAVGDDEAIITVPPAHLEALLAFVYFAGHAELSADQAVALSDSSVVLAQLNAAARAAWTRYKEVMDRLVWLGGGGPGAGPLPVWGEIGL